MTPKSKYSTASDYVTPKTYSGDTSRNIIGGKDAGKSFGSSVSSLFNDNKSLLKQDSNIANGEQDKTTNTATQVLGAIGPWWGELAKIGTQASKDRIGEGGDWQKNTQGVILDPFNQFKDNQGTDEWLKSFIAPGMTAVTKGKRIQEDYERRLNNSLLKQRDDNQKVGAIFQNSLQRYQAPQYGKRGMKIRTRYGS